MAKPANVDKEIAHETCPKCGEKTVEYRDQWYCCLREICQWSGRLHPLHYHSRPKNWFNPHYKLSQIDPRVVQRKEDFEAGATAILATTISEIERKCSKCPENCWYKHNCII